MSLGHTEPITQKHTLRKHPREESSELDLKAVRLREVLQIAQDYGTFDKRHKVSWSKILSGKQERNRGMSQCEAPGTKTGQ